jgi:ribosomal protein L32
MPNVPSDGEKKMITHVCPVCGKSHAVNAARHSVAWGRQFTCSCECESERRRRMRRQPLEFCPLRAQAGR